MRDPLERLTRVVEVHMTDAMIDAYNALEGYAACAGIKDHPDTQGDNGKSRAGAATKARTNHYGHPTKGAWAEPRVFITNATDSADGTHKRMPSAEIALQKAVMDAFRNSIKRQQVYRDLAYDYTKISKGSNLAFGTTNSPTKVLSQVAAQMHENQMIALAAVTPKNTDATLKRKKKRSTSPLIDYGEMRAACTFWVDSGEEDEDVEQDV